MRLLQYSFLPFHFVVVVVGYVDTLVEVNEADGQATLNISISSPQPDPVFSLELMFSLNLASTQSTAGMDDDIPQWVYASLINGSKNGGMDDTLL